MVFIGGRRGDVDRREFVWWKKVSLIFGFGLDQWA
jgi:hypothetical protein